MKVRDIFTREAKACRPDTNLAEVGSMMWQADCGVIPVTDDEMKVLGVMTDRDAFIALATRNRLAGDLRAMEVMRGPATACTLDDDVHDALATMQNGRIRRLPVVDANGKLQGILSIDDIARAARPKKAAKPGDVDFEEVAESLQAICRNSPHREAAATR